MFLTAGAFRGPCRFGMYVTEYRKALRDAGFDGFRVMLFQQQGGLSQATGEESGLDLNAPFFMGMLKGLIAGDVINGIGYRLRPYEVTKLARPTRPSLRPRRFVTTRSTRSAASCGRSISREKSSRRWKSIGQSRSPRWRSSANSGR